MCKLLKVNELWYVQIILGAKQINIHWSLLIQKRSSFCVKPNL